MLIAFELLSHFAIIDTYYGEKRYPGLGAWTQMQPITLSTAYKTEGIYLGRICCYLICYRSHNFCLQDFHLAFCVSKHWDAFINWFRWGREIWTPESRLQRPLPYQLGYTPVIFSTPGRTRTYNLRIRSALLYPVEPRVRKYVVLNHNAFIGASPEAFTFIF